MRERERVNGYGGRDTGDGAGEGGAGAADVGGGAASGKGSGALYGHDLTRQIETHHYVTRINQDFLQCAVYDSDESHGRLIGTYFPLPSPYTFSSSLDQLFFGISG